jgi:hypothetical protein
MAAKKIRKIYDVNVSVRKIDNGYVVKSYGYLDNPKDYFSESDQHEKELMYASKEEAVKSAMSLIDAFSKDLI